MMALSLAFSCTPDGDFEPIDQAVDHSHTRNRQEVTQQRHVLVLVSGGYNSLSSYLTEDLQDIAQGYVPEGTDAYTNALVVLSRLPINELSTTSVPVLYRMYKDAEGAIVRDTLRRYSETDVLFSQSVLQSALETVQNRLPAKSYGMVLSSHASGWLPVGYYDKPSNFESRLRPRSIGQDKDDDVSTEMDLQVFADCIPKGMMEYILLDCCLSGGVEVAYELRERTKYIAFTQTETMADGFDYKSMMTRLLSGSAPNPQGVCEDFYNYYMAKTGVYRSATISLVNTSALPALANVCSTLFEKYRSAISSMNGDLVQGYFRYERHFFYDLRHILSCAGITYDEMVQLDEALNDCIPYKAATPYFMEGTQYGFSISHYCGLSMYLPSMGTEFLNQYYKEHISWNEATHLVL